MNRYTQADKAQYLNTCRRYNAAKDQGHGRPAEYVRCSLELHQQRGTVPTSWRAAAFIARVGT